MVGRKLSDRYPVLGGGTPTHLPDAKLERLFEILASRFEWSTSTEISAECNPSDLNAAKAASLSRVGVNRVSLGVQSLNSEKLRLLERDHDRAVVEDAVGYAREFAKSISIDLIFAAPNETLERWEVDLEEALKLGSDHISTYELTFEKGTQFWNRRQHGKLTEAGDSLCCEMYELAIERTRRLDFVHYEISSFARPGHMCRHNLAYWNGQPYFAFGPGASRFVDGVRETNHRSTSRYIQRVQSGASPVAEREKLSPFEAAMEQLVIGLRLRAGVDDSEFKARTGFSWRQLVGEELMKRLTQEGFWETENDVLRLTHRGMLVCDGIAAEILKDD